MHTLIGQHAIPIAPHGAHVFADPVQANPVAHVLPEQHGCELPPHASHMPPLSQMFPELHTLPEQHA